MPTIRLSLGLALVATALTAAYLMHATPSGVPPTPTQNSSPSAAASSPLPAPQQASTPVAAPATLNAVGSTTQELANPLERSEDLRAIYDRFKDSRVGLERQMAYRAWSACFPTLIAPQGQPISIESLTRALPPNDPHIALRVEAYRNLQARCRNFSELTREQTLSATRRQQEAPHHGDLFSPGELAAQHLSDGNKEAALMVARAVIASRDPFAVGSLREFIQRYLVLQVDAQMTAGAERPDLRALAFTLAACQLGLECGPASLTALQLCASLGQCAGGVVDRYLQALPDPADREAAQAESRRVVQAVQSNDFGALGL